MPRSSSILKHPNPSAATIALAAAALGACDLGQTGPEAALEIVPDSVTLTHVGERFAFTVEGGGGPEAGKVRWSSRDTAVFKVDENGTVTARGNGVSHVLAWNLKSADGAAVEVRQVAAVLEAFGAGQRVAPGLSLLEPVGVRVLDAGGTPVAGVAVRFEPGPGGGRVEPGEVYSDSAGVAAARWTLGRVLGEQVLVASAGGGTSVEIATTALAPDEAAAEVEIGSGNDQWELRGSALPEPVVVRVLEESGRPVWGASVRFEPEAGSGRADPGVAKTDTLGLASATWTLGPEQGVQRLEATAGQGLAVTFEAIAASDEGVCNRTPAVSAAIVQALRHRRIPVEGCAEVTEERLREVRRLDLSGRGIRELRSGDFAGLVNLEVMLLHDNALTELPADVFTGLDSLGYIGLRNNRLRRLRPGVFDELAALEGMNLSGNELTELRPGVFDRLAALKRLTLNNNELTALPLGVFDRLQELEFLNLGDNRLRELRPGLLANLTHLDHLDLANNGLVEIPPRFLAGLSSLRWVSLGSNELTQLPPDIFKGLTRLADLYLFRNRLTELAPRTFADLQSLTWLDLRNNELTELPPDVFGGLSKLGTLYLRGNRLTSLPEDIFSGLSNVRSLSVAGNLLTRLPPGLFAETPRLERIALEANRLTELPPDLFAGTPRLQRLYLQRNRLAELPPGIFEGLPELVRLDLSSSGLAGLRPGVFAGTPRISEVSLDDNELTELPRGVFAGLSELNWVTLHRNPGAPFPVRPEFVRVDVDDPLAPGPARVVMRVPTGAPFEFGFPVSVQRGTLSRAFMSVLPGDTASAPFEVSGTGGGAGAAHVGFGPPTEVTEVGYTGLALVRGEELVLFAEADNRSPLAGSPVPAHRLQSGGPAAELVLGEHFSDPDGDTLSYEVMTTEPGVVAARIEAGVLRLEPRSVDTTEVEVAAVDPGGLRATHRFNTWVVPAPDPDAFNIELFFAPGFTAEEEATVRRAADRWMEAVTGDLPDVPIRGPLQGYCRNRSDVPQPWPRAVGVIDDVLIHMSLGDLGRYLGGVNVSCGRRDESGMVFLSRNVFHHWYIRNRSGYLYEVALHEIGHTLGIGLWTKDLGPESWWLDLYRDKYTDPYFAGTRAVAAFNAAGGEGYTGGKVPLEDTLPGRYIHWRTSVIPDDIMAPGGGSLLTAITLGALADLGHEVDMSKAEPYTLPVQVQADVPGDAGEAEGGDVEVLRDTIIRGPVVVVDKDGNVVRVIRR